MIGYKFAYTYHYKNILFSTSDNFDEVCHVEGRNKLYEFVTRKNILDDFMLWCTDIMICANKTINIRQDSGMKMIELIDNVTKTRSQLEDIIKKTHGIINNFKLLRTKVIDRLFHAELLDNYTEKVKVKTTKVKYDEKVPAIFYGSFYHKLIDRFNIHEYTKHMNDYMGVINNYNYMDELIDWIQMLVYALYKSGSNNDLILELMKVSTDAMGINKLSIDTINKLKIIQDIYLEDFIRYYADIELDIDDLEEE